MPERQKLRKSVPTIFTQLDSIWQFIVRMSALHCVTSLLIRAPSSGIDKGDMWRNWERIKLTYTQQNQRKYLLKQTRYILQTHLDDRCMLLKCCSSLNHILQCSADQQINIRYTNIFRKCANLFNTILHIFYYFFINLWLHACFAFYKINKFDFY